MNAWTYSFIGELGPRGTGRDDDDDEPDDNDERSVVLYVVACRGGKFVGGSNVVLAVELEGES